MKLGKNMRSEGKLRLGWEVKDEVFDEDDCKKGPNFSMEIEEAAFPYGQENGH
jgi:hypothetical protein